MRAETNTRGGAVNPHDKFQYICEAWGESDRPIVRVVDDFVGVRKFFKENWYGEQCAELDESMTEVEEHFHEEDAWEETFEIGGVSVRRVYHEEPSNNVPGEMHCAKCKFALIRTNLYVNSGTAGPGDNKTEPCPNGCGPLWPVTWEKSARDCWQRLEQMFNEKQAFEKDAQRWRWWRTKFNVLCRLSVARDVGLDLTKCFVDNPSAMDIVTDAAIDGGMRERA